nr:hypothetical protein CFP56_09567 [Quercus suber]
MIEGEVCPFRYAAQRGTPKELPLFLITFAGFWFMHFSHFLPNWRYGTKPSGPNNIQVILRHQERQSFAGTARYVRSQYTKSWLSSALQRLTIVGLEGFSQDRDDSLVPDDRQTLSLFTTALTNFSATFLLRSLVLAQHRYRPDFSSNTPHCALSPSELALFKVSMNIEACTSLSLAIRADYEDTAAGEASAQFPPQIIQMIEGTRSLKHLHVRWFKVRTSSFFEEKQTVTTCLPQLLRCPYIYLSCGCLSRRC